MKKFLWVFSVFLAFVVVFASCSKDDDENTSQNQIVGKWQVTGANKIENGKIVATSDEMTGVMFEFNSNLSYSAIYQNVLKETGTYFINGSVISIKETGDDDYSPATFTISDDTLHIYVNSVNENKETEVVTISEMILKRIN